MQKPILERAFELARSGHCDSVRAIEFRMKGEGYQIADVLPHLEPRGLREQLKRLCEMNFAPSLRVLRVAG